MPFSAGADGVRRCHCGFHRCSAAHFSSRVWVGRPQKPGTRKANPCRTYRPDDSGSPLMAGVVAIGRMCDHPMVSFGLVAKLVERQVTLDTEDPDEKYHRLCREHEEEVFNPIKRARARARERKRENRNHRRLLKLKVILERYSEWATVIDISSTDEFKEWFKENQHWYKFNERDLYEDPDDLLAVPSHFGAGSAAA
jgi:hypothetical protein